DFRSLKTDDLDLRPIYHRLKDRVRAHVLICMLAAYLTWHLRKALAPLTFTDENPPERDNPVAPAHRSTAANTKASRKTTTDTHLPPTATKDCSPTWAPSPATKSTSPAPTTPYPRLPTPPTPNAEHSSSSAPPSPSPCSSQNKPPTNNEPPAQPGARHSRRSNVGLGRRHQHPSTTPTPSPTTSPG